MKFVYYIVVCILESMTSSDSYYCYLIKSIKTNTSTSTYIGFSTNPINRLRQHNGEITQGNYHIIKKNSLSSVFHYINMLYSIFISIIR